MTLTDWAALLLADCSSNNLLIFADWLELDQDDEELAQAARGVRELLVREGRRPYRLNLPSYSWWNRPDDFTDVHLLSNIKSLFRYLQHGDRSHKEDKPFCHRSYPLTAEGHLTALLDAAQAWAKCNPEKKEQPQTTGSSRA